MQEWQKFIVIFFAIYAIFGLINSFVQIVKKNNPFGLCYQFVLIGAFVWGDSLVFGIFWLIATIVLLLLNNWLLFLVVYVVFWLVRSVVEVFYWLNQQFSSKLLEPPNRYYLSKIFPDNSVWFIHQILWQCAVVFFTVILIYLVKQL